MIKMFGAMLLTVITLTSCGDSKSSSSTASVSSTESKNQDEVALESVVCDSANDGEILKLADSNASYQCQDGEWINAFNSENTSQKYSDPQAEFEK